MRPKEVDVYYESVTGKVFRVVLPLLNMLAYISLYVFLSSLNNATGLPQGPDRFPLLLSIIL